MKMNSLAWTVVVVVFLFTFSSANAQLQPPYFHDDFEDGSVEDGNPVSWSLLPPFDQGTNEVIDGDYILTPANTSPLPQFPNFSEIDSYVEGLEFSEVSIRTQVRGLRFADYFVGMIARNTGESTLGVGIDPRGEVALWATDYAGNNDTWTYNSRFDPSRNDIHLRLDVLTDQAMLWVWEDGDQPTEHPQVITYIPDYIAESGRIGIWNGENRVGTIRTPVAYRFFEAAPIPEPTGLTLCVFAMMGLFGCARRMNK